MVICMHMHGICSLRTPKRTSLGPPPRAMEMLAMAAAAAQARAAKSYVEPWPLAATAASAWPPVRAGVGGLRARTATYRHTHERTAVQH